MAPTNALLTQPPPYQTCYLQGAAWRSRLHVLTRNVEVVGSSPIKGPRCFLEQKTLPLLHSTGWFQERIRACYHNRTKIN